MGRAFARMEESISSLNVLTGKPTGKSPLEWPRRRWEENIRTHLEEIPWLSIQRNGLIRISTGFTGDPWCMLH